MPPIAGPNHTQIPNTVLDAMGAMSGAEFKIVNAVCRKTFGWQKRQDVLSISQLIELTGLSRPTVVEGINAAIEHGWITREKHGLSFRYSVNLSNQLENLTSKETLPVAVKKSNQLAAATSKEIEPTKESVKETTKEKEDDVISPEFASVVEAYENAIGTINGYMADALKDAVADYSAQWVIDAMAETAKSNKRNWRYTEAILRNWKAEGRKPKTPPLPARPPVAPLTFIPNPVRQTK